MTKKILYLLLICSAHFAFSMEEKSAEPATGIYDYEVFKSRIKIRALAKDYLKEGKKEGNAELARRKNVYGVSGVYMKQGLRFMKNSDRTTISGTLQTPWGCDFLFVDDRHNPLPSKDSLLFFNKLNTNGVFLKEDNGKRIQFFNMFFNIVSVDGITLPTPIFGPILRDENLKKIPDEVISNARLNLGKRYTTDEVDKVISVKAVAAIVMDYWSQD